MITGKHASETVTIKHWYGEESRKIEITSGKDLWYQVGKAAVEIRWVIIGDRFEKFETQAVLCLAPNAKPLQMVSMVYQAVAVGSDL